MALHQFPAWPSLQGSALLSWNPAAHCKDVRALLLERTYGGAPEETPTCRGRVEQQRDALADGTMALV